MTYFLFLSVKQGFFEEDLFKFVINEIYFNKTPMEIESIVNLLFTFSRLEKMLGLADFHA